MIKIDKGTVIPQKLLVEGKAQTEANQALYEEYSTDYQSGLRSFSFDKDIYGHPTVKEALRCVQHHKCCFCERKEEIGDVEHFRPKSAYQQKTKGKLAKPGYYWLAYEWDNLFYSCPTCNRSYKKNLFPLVNPTQRAKSHLDNLSLEESLFINPTKENPEEYIEFIRDKPRAIDGNLKGKTTIERTGLARPFLDEDRNTHYKQCQTIYQVIPLLPPESLERQAAIAFLEEAVQNKAQFSSMIRCAIRDQFRY